MESLPIEAFAQPQIFERRDDEIHGHDVDAAALEADHRRPGRQNFTKLLNQLEEVIGSVDLVDLAGLRIPDDDPRPVDAPGNLRLRPDNRFAVVLGPEIGVIEAPRFFKHILAKNPFIQARGGNRAHVMKAAGVDVSRKFQCIPHAIDVRGGDLRRICRQVVDRGEMEDVIDLAFEPADGLRIRAQIGFVDVAEDRRHALRRGPPCLPQSREGVGRGVAHKRKDRQALSLKQAARESFSDEAARAGYEDIHGHSPTLWAQG